MRLPGVAINAAVQLVSLCPHVPNTMSLGRYGCDSSHIAQVHLQPIAPPVSCCPAFAVVQPGVGCSTDLGATGGQGGVGQEAVLEPQRRAAFYGAATNIVRDNFKQQILSDRVFWIRMERPATVSAQSCILRQSHGQQPRISADCRLREMTSTLPATHLPCKGYYLVSIQHVNTHCNLWHMTPLQPHTHTQLSPKTSPENQYHWSRLGPEPRKTNIKCCTLQYVSSLRSDPSYWTNRGKGGGTWNENLGPIERWTDKAFLS